MGEILFCDKCNKTPAIRDYDGIVLCRKHRTKYELKLLVREYESMKKWVIKCWISELIKKKNEITKLKKTLKEEKLQNKIQEGTLQKGGIMGMPINRPNMNLRPKNAPPM